MMFDDPFKNEWTFDEMIENQITEQEQQPSNSISVIEQQNNKQEKQDMDSMENIKSFSLLTEEINDILNFLE